MKITPTLLSIPPYLSTSWSNISSLRIHEERGALSLIIALHDGPQVEIPNLSKESIHAIFDAHAQHMEEEGKKKQREELPFSLTLPFKNGGTDTLESFPPTAQHNPDQADLPPLPAGVLKKISAIASALGEDSVANLPKAEPDCNCIYCQVMRAIQGETAIEEEITEEDLRFRNWDIRQTAEKLYIVSNPIDTNEHYSVFLGEPIGCTCGCKNCEHVRAVLST